MSAPDWQLTVLHELGVTPAGLVATGTTTPVTPAPRSLTSSGDATVVLGRQQPPVKPALDDRTLLDFRPPPVPAPLPAPVLTPGSPPWDATEPAARPASPGRHALPAAYHQPEPTAGQPPATTRFQSPGSPQLKQAADLQTRPAAFGQPAPAAGPTGSHAAPPPHTALGQPATTSYDQALPNAAGKPGDHRAALEAAPTTTHNRANLPIPNSPTREPHQLENRAHGPQTEPATAQADGVVSAQVQPGQAVDHAAGVAGQSHPAFGPVEVGPYVQAAPEAVPDPGLASVPVGHNHPPILVGARPEAEGLVRRAKHGDPLARRVGRGMRRMVGAHAGQDKRELDEAEARLRQPVSTCRQIAFTSIRGGAGKTTVASLVAQTIAAHRDGRTLAIDADPGLGSLPLRLGTDAARSLRDVAASQPRTWEDAEALLSRTGERLWVSPATSGRRIETELELPVFNTAVGLLSRYFSVAVMDCGAGLLTGLHRGILDGAHGQVLVTPGTVDGALSARGAIDWFRENGLEALLSRTVVVLVSHTPHEDADIENARKLLSDLPVFHLPYDRHLSAGSAIDPAMLSESVRSAAVQISVAVFSRATLA